MEALPIRALPLPPKKLVALVLVAGMALSGCMNSARSEKTTPAAVAETTSTSTSTTSSSTTTSTTSTTAKPTTTTTAPPPGLGVGASGSEVAALERRLSEMGYEVGNADGRYDMSLWHAVMAFQKVQGLPRTGRATDDVVKALSSAGAPGPLLPSAEADRVEIDLKRQVLFLYKGGKLDRVLSVSTGNNKRYCVDGQCDTAVTPGGSFKVFRKIRGLRVSRLGKLYNPLYFNGGIAIHGSPSVPGSPASHGCVRIPMSSSLAFFEAVPSGTPVYVVGGRKAPVPFNEQAPPEEKSAGSSTTTSTTTTTAKPTTTTTPLTPTTSSSTTTTTTSTTTTTTTTTTTPPRG